MIVLISLLQFLPQRTESHSYEQNLMKMEHY